MTTQSHRETATIYIFPARGRFAPDDSRGGSSRLNEQCDVPTVMGNGWYHDEAIREERTRKK